MAELRGQCEDRIDNDEASTYHDMIMIDDDVDDGFLTCLVLGKLI